MRHLRPLLLAVAALVIAAVPAAVAASASPAQSTSQGLPAGVSTSVTATHNVLSIPTVGPLFAPSFLGLGPYLQLPHYCTASVIDSPSGDLVITAAHCVTGDGVGIQFAPGYHDGVSPYGVWTVRSVYVDPAWLTSQNPQDDIAILQMWPHNGESVQDVTGGAAVGTAPAAGTAVTVDGYVAGAGGEPITCTANVYYTSGYPGFDCDGYQAGVSGGPFLADGTVVGVIGGLNQGGCSDNTSYSSTFGSQVKTMLARAEAGGAGDTVPVAGGDGC